MTFSLAFAGYTYLSTPHVDEIVSQNIEALSYDLDEVTIYPSADGYTYVAMYYKNQYGTPNGIYMDVTESDTQTEKPYKMRDDAGNIAYKCSTWRAKVSSSVKGHCFLYNK